MPSATASAVVRALRDAIDDGCDTGLWSLPNVEYLKLQDRLAALAPVKTLIAASSRWFDHLGGLRRCSPSAPPAPEDLAFRHGYHGHSASRRSPPLR